MSCLYFLPCSHCPPIIGTQTCAAGAAPKPFDLESFLRDEAKIDEDGVKEYLPLLKKNKIDENVLMMATNADLKEWGITAGGDRKCILAEIEKCTGKKV